MNARRVQFRAEPGGRGEEGPPVVVVVSKLHVYIEQGGWEEGGGGGQQKHIDYPTDFSYVIPLRQAPSTLDELSIIRTYIWLISLQRCTHYFKLIKLKSQ